MVVITKKIMMKWDKRKLGRYFWCTLVIATVVSCGAVIYTSFVSKTGKVSSLQTSKYHPLTSEKLTEEKCIPVCETKECVSQSKMQHGLLSGDVNPCEDFHQFVCGKLYERVDPYESKSLEVDSRKAILVNLKSVLDSIKAKPESVSGKLKTVYDSCMIHGSSDVQAVPAVLRFLHNIGLSGYPNLAPDFQFVNPNITGVILNFLSYQEYAFIEFSAKVDFFHSMDDFVDASLSDGNAAYESYEKSKRKYFVDRIFGYLNMDGETIKKIWEESEAILDAITKLKEESRKNAEEKRGEGNFRNSYFDPFRITSNCTKKADDAAWNHICRICATLIQNMGAADHVSKNNMNLYRTSEYFLENIFTVLSNFSDRSLANYLALNVFLKNMNEMNFYFRTTRAKVGVTHPPTPLVKWEKCVQWLSHKMTLALGYEYVKKIFTLPMIKDVQEVSEECIREAADLWSHQNWVPDDLKTRIKEEILDFVVVFEYFIDILSNETSINEFYEKFNPTDESYLHNVLEFEKFLKFMEMNGKLKVELSDNMESIFIPDAAGGDGTVDIKFGLLFPPLYLFGRDRLTNLLSIGSFVLHEIGHNLQSILRISDESYYEEKIKCLEDQYSQFVVKTIGKHLDGKKLITENFADSIGISGIDWIVEKYASHEFQGFLPNFSFPMKQQMYISNMQVWCSYHKKEDEELRFHIDGHSPPNFRLLGMMQNSKGFSEAFGCPSGSYMNPPTKCTFFH